MSKIKSLLINNFKFFRDSPPLELNGNHLLLYGENGSGKSSLYYALYTLLQAASKQVPDVQKYFTPGTSESLVNIYADDAHGPANTGSFISIEDLSGHIYNLSYANNACMLEVSLLESNRASDFMNYMSLFRFQLFRNSQTADLHDVFRLTILPFLSFPEYTFKGKSLKGAEDLYNAYKRGPGTTTNPQGKVILVYKNSAEYAEFVNLEKHFNDQMQSLVDFINANVNSKIEEFDYDFKVELSYTAACHEKKETWIDYTKPFGITLKVTEYNGKPVNIVHPNTFLNEAKMTALAFSIRWAILDYRLRNATAPDALKVLVLDDIMISLDMANRNKLIRIITTKLAKEYQILFLTHDMLLFDSMKNELMSIYGKKEEELKDTDWTLVEMYDTKNGTEHKPFIQPPMAAYDKALKYFHGDRCAIDYTASGNSIRQALEAAFKNVFRKANLTHNANGDAIEIEKLMIGDCIGLARTFKDRLGISDELITTIESLRFCMLNPASHDNPGRNYYRQELIDSFNVYQYLANYSHQIIVPKDESVNFKIVCGDGTEHNYTVHLKQNLIACRLLDANSYTVYWSKGSFDVTDSDDPKHRTFHPHGETLEKIFIDSYQYLSKGDQQMRVNFPYALDAIQYNGQTLREIINKL